MVSRSFAGARQAEKETWAVSAQSASSLPVCACILLLNFRILQDAKIHSPSGPKLMIYNAAVRRRVRFQSNLKRGLALVLLTAGAKLNGFSSDR